MSWNVTIIGPESPQLWRGFVSEEDATKFGAESGHIFRVEPIRCQSVPFVCRNGHKDAHEADCL